MIVIFMMMAGCCWLQSLFFLSKLETVFKLKCHDDENETVALDNAV